MAVLQIELLGGLRVSVDGAPITGFYSNKAPALLAYLALTGRIHSRDALAALFWGDMPDADARTNLRQALTNLRKLLAPHLVITRETVAFNPNAPYTFDIEEYEAALKAGDNERAVGLYQGDFLDGLFVRDASEFEEWMLGQRARLRELAAQAMHSLLRHFAATGSYARGIEIATRLLALDPWREETHRELMLLYARGGQRSAAQTQYETCRRILAEQLGVKPSVETTAWYERIRAAGEAMPNNLKPQPTSFVGRTAELEQLEGLLLSPERRLVTLLGAGGTGKTRLALASAERLLAIGAFLHGVFWVPLAGINTPEMLAPAIAEACQLSLSGERFPHRQLAQLLRDKEILLVLDNFEHLVDAAGWLAQLLLDAPHVKLLVTSRERLDLQWEWLLPLEGLAYAPTDADGAPPSEAARLFIERVRQVRPDFPLDAGALSSIAHICRLVEGMPLGIELASAWARVHSCAEIATEIERGYNVLATTMRDVPARQRSVQATFEHSWRLLSPAEREVFMRLSVFRAGFTPAAAVQIAGANDALLAALLDKSLLRRMADVRFEEHSLLRQYGEEKLREAGALPDKERAHARYFAGWLEAQRSEIRDARQAGMVRLVGADIANARTMWHWSLRERDWVNLSRSAGVLYRYFESTALFQQGEALFAEVDKADETLPADRRAFIANRRGVMLWRSGQYQAALAVFEDVLARADGQVRESRVERANAEHQIGTIYMLTGNYAGAKQHLTAALTLWSELGDTNRHAAVQIDLASTFAGLGENEKSRALYHEILEFSRRNRNLHHVGILLENLAGLEYCDDRYKEALALYEQSLDAYRQIGQPSGALNVRTNMVQVHLASGDFKTAAAILDEVEQPIRERGLGNQLMIHVIKFRGLVLLALGQPGEAQLYFREALSIAHEIATSSAMVSALMGFAMLRRTEARLADAALLVAFTRHHQAPDQYVRAEEWYAAEQRAAGCTLAQVAAFALSE